MATTTASSKRELARLVGKSEAAVRKWLKDDRWPFGQAGPWHVDQVKAWAAKVLAPENASAKKPPAPKPAPKRAAPPPPAEPADEPDVPDDAGAADAEPGDEDEISAEEERRQNIRLKRARAEKLEHDTAVDKGEFVRREDVVRAFAQVAGEVKSDLMNLPEAVVPAMQGLTVIEQQDVLRGRLLEVLRHLAGDGVPKAE